MQLFLLILGNFRFDLIRLLFWLDNVLSSHHVLWVDVHHVLRVLRVLDFLRAHHGLWVIEISSLATLVFLLLLFRLDHICFFLLRWLLIFFSLSWIRFVSKVRFDSTEIFIDLHFQSHHSILIFLDSFGWVFNRVHNSQSFCDIHESLHEISSTLALFCNKFILVFSLLIHFSSFSCWIFCFV